MNGIENFLSSIKKEDGSYKIYRGSLLSYPGGKSKAVGTILEKFPKDIKRVVSPFFGGGSVEFACALECGIEVLGFDLHKELIIFYNEVKNNPYRIYENLIKMENNDKVYREIKKKLLDNIQGVNILNDEEIAYMFAYNFGLSYGPQFLGWFSSNFKDRNKYERFCQKLKKFSFKNIILENRSFDFVLKKFNEDFLYLDPPYYIGEGSKMHKECYYHHKNFNHKLLADMLKLHRGKFLMSYNDCPFIRETYKEFNIIEVKWRYTMQMGEKRIGKKRILNGNLNGEKDSHEILIANYEI